MSEADIGRIDLAYASRTQTIQSNLTSRIAALGSDDEVLGKIVNGVTVHRTVPSDLVPMRQATLQASTPRNELTKQQMLQQYVV